MGSFKGNGRDRGPGRRRNAADRRKKAFPGLESLERRTLLAGDPPVWHPTNNNLADVVNGPLGNAGDELIKVYFQYQNYRQTGVSGAFATSPINTENKYIYFSGDSVGVQVRSNGSGDFNALINTLKGLGMQVGGTDANFKVIEGQLPINQLPTVAQLPQTGGLHALYIPIAYSQGKAPNQAEQSLKADTAKTQFNVNGTGVGVGVISTSVDRIPPGGGLASSVSTGDLPKKADGTPAVTVLADNQTGILETDEGRAMLENIYDIAPGANLAFHTAVSLTGGETFFAQGVRRLATEAKDQVIVDDIGVATEPYYQDGIVAQAIADVTRNNNVTYFSSAGNSADSGFESPFRGVTTNVTGLGSGRYMDFDPGSGVTAGLPITVNTPGLMVFQFDQAVGAVSSDVNIFILDSNNAIVAQGTSNNIATGQPMEIVGIPSAGSYTAVIQVQPGSSDPGRVVMYQFSAGITFSKQFDGSGGGITHPTTFGHPTSDFAIGVGAVPWWVVAPFQPFTPTPSEQFSSFGPSYKVFNSDGTRKAQLEVQQKPDVSGADGVDITFPLDGAPDISTVNPPQGTGPATSKEFDLDTIPNFFGTSSAAPNLAAVAALMKQLSPSATLTDIKNAMIASTIPLNGKAKGTWDVQGGYGLVQATAALSAVDRLRVVTTTPTAGQTLTTAPTAITVNFSRNINPASVQASDLVFTQTPPGVTVTVGTPVVNPSNPTQVTFPLTFNAPLGLTANGTFKFALADGAIISSDNRPLVAFTSSFALNDTIAPRVTNTIFTGRLVVATFSEPLNPATVTKSSVVLIRSGGTGVFNNPANVIVSGNPRTFFTYDAPNNRIIFDLTNLNQQDLPSDTYALVIYDTVRDAVGNRLDGEFSGVFPSGNGQQGGSFIQVVNAQLQAPQIASVKLDAASDSGITGDGNTKVTQPSFIGQVNSAFPGAVSGITIVAQFNDLHGGAFDLRLGPADPRDPVQPARTRGFLGSPDAVAITNAAGQFVFKSPSALEDGFNSLRLIAVGAPDQPPQPGYSSLLDTSFRVDTTNPFISGSSLANNAAIGALSTISLNVTDPIKPATLGDPLAVPTQFKVPALNPAAASNINNYSLINLGPDRTLGTADDRDFSSAIVSATYVDTTLRNQTNDPFTGRVDLRFGRGVPAGRYALVARQPQAGFSGLVDAAGNALDGDGSTPGTQDFKVVFDLQPTPVYITSVLADTPDPNGGADVLTGPRSFYELPQPGVAARAIAPPTSFIIDFSNPLDPTKDYTNAIQLIRSANNASAAPDGDFGDLGQAGGTGTGFTRVPGTTVVLKNQIQGAQFGQPGFQNELIIRIAPGTSLPADNYRLYIPNTGANIILDQFGNQLDGENLGDPDPNRNVPASRGGLPLEPTVYETLLPNGQYRTGLSGDLVPGGAFMTGYTVVPNGNVIYARPDYIDNPSLSSDDPDGSLLKPYPGLAAEAIATTGPNGNGGDLNSASNFGTNFDPRLDRNGSLNTNPNRGFDRSALFAAQQIQTQPGHQGPVVVVALPAANDPNQTFVLQAPSGTDPLFNNASVSIPANTSLVFAPGSTLKLRNASIFVQNQGTAIQMLGGPNPLDKVTLTSYSDDTIGGDTNGDGSDSTARGGDWGGILLRNFDDTSNGGRSVPEAPSPINPSHPATVDKVGLSGADDVMSALNFGQIRFAGGAVPQTIGYRFDALTLFNSRPSITNTIVSQTGANGSAQSAISGDLDSFREDDTARGPLIRRVTVSNNSLNGILVRADTTGVVEASDAKFYATNPSTLGGDLNYTFDDPLPYVLVTRMVVGTKLIQGTGGQTVPFPDRVYIQPGSMFKSQRGAAIEVSSSLDPTTGQPFGGGASLNVGDRTYINQWDLNHNLAPTDPGFVPNNVGDAKVLFTSLFDDNASTSFFDPVTGTTTTIVPKIDTDNGGAVNLPTAGSVPDLARWGDIEVDSGNVIVMDEAQIQFAGGSINTPGGTIGQRDALAFQGAGGSSAFGVTRGAFGTRAMITNNDFFDNRQAAASIEPDGLLAADPLRPLVSGNPFFRGNVMQRNDLNGLEVLPSLQNFVGYVPNLHVDSVWDDTDLTYVLRGTVRLDGSSGFGFGSSDFPSPDPTQFTAELKPHTVLTIQSSLPDTLLADGSKVARPGESVLVKLLNAGPSAPLIGDGVNGFGPNANIGADSFGGAGFMVGIDDGVDPPADPLVDAGAFSQIRILGIGGNETTGQQRVPAIITSLRDDSVGKTVRGVTMNAALSGNTTAPAPGDGGVIAFGGLSLSDYNLLDPRDGNLIDNADIRYITRIEQQGGGIVYASTGTAVSNFNTKLGITAPTQFNTQKAMTVSNSNLSSFSQVGFIAHPAPTSAAALTIPAPVPGGPPVFAFPARDTGGARGESTVTYFVNNTFSNMPVGVRINSEQSTDTPGFQQPAEAVFLNNTFDKNGTAIYAQGIPQGSWSVTNYLGHVFFFAMDNIFSNSSTSAITVDGQTFSRFSFGNGGGQHSRGQYNLYSANAVDIQSLNGGIFDNDQPVAGSPNYRDQASGDVALPPYFALGANSDAIDASRSEIGPFDFGNTLRPIADQRLDATGGIRNTTGRINAFGGAADISTPGDILSLPGLLPQDRGYNDQFVPAIPGSPGAIPGPTSNAGGVFSYTPITGQRDQLGFLRVDDPSRANVGFGQTPFFDIGAFEFRQLFPPHITGVTAIVTSPGSPTPAPINIYAVGAIAGTNKTPQSIQIQFDNRLDTNTINNKTILLEASGGDGIFGNNNSANDKFIDLSGKLLFDPNTKVLTINLGSSNLILPNDEYRVFVLGSGADVIRDPQGNALDGENTNPPNDPNGLQRALPSGDQFPGGNFYVTFTVDTNPPAIDPTVPVSLASTSDSNVVGDNITNTALPTFTGQITDIFPPLNPLVGQTVIVDVSTKGDGVFDRMNAGTAVTGANGVFLVTVTGTPLPDTQYNVGPDGILGTTDDSGYSIARIRIVDQSGNVSNPNDPNAQVKFVVDTKGPRITGSNPLPGAQITPAANNTVAVAIAVNENLDLSRLSAGSIVVTRSGGDGIFGSTGTKPDVTLSIDPASFTIENLKTSTGAEIIRFNVLGVSANDVYRITLLGTGGSPVIDIAGNPLDGEFSGVFPSGNGTPGGDFNLDFIVLNPTLSRLVFVSQGATGGSPNGTRANPYPTIAAGLAAANIGDTVAVLPGVYTENVVMKSLVHLLSADPKSTNTTFFPGNALKTIIRGPQGVAKPTVSATNLISVPSFSTEIGGFTISSPLTGDPSTGKVTTGSMGVMLINSDILVDKNYVINSDYGIVAALGGSVAVTPRIESNGLIGNNMGVLINDAASGALKNGPVEVANNDFAFNTYGILVNATGNVSPLATVVNDIFFQNASKTAGRAGAAIYDVAKNRLTLQSNLFAANGPNITGASDDVIGESGAFNPFALGPNPDANGNFTGDPGFQIPLDPRPNADGEANFILGANYDLRSSSAAIDNALNVAAPTLDFLYRSRVKITNRGFAGRGPADIGAFEFNGAASPITTGGTGATGTGTSGTTGLVSVRSLSTTPSATSSASSSPATKVAIPPAVVQDAAAKSTASSTTASSSKGITNSVRSTPAQVVVAQPPVVANPTGKHAAAPAARKTLTVKGLLASFRRK